VLAGDALRHRGPRGERVSDESYVVWLHADGEDRTVELPHIAPAYLEVLRTDDAPAGSTHAAGSTLTMTARSVVVLQATG
jgi:glycogen operon protein